MSPGTMKTIMVIAVTFALVACSGGPTDDPGAHSLGLVDSPPLPTLAEQDWLGAPEGCEGRLDGSEEFGITQSDALIVANREGATVCVDTLEAVSIELEALGAGFAADELYSGFYAAIHLSQVEDWASPASDMLEDGGEASGDPNPQPNDTALPPEGDPNPQPNLPDDLTPSIEDPTPSMPDPSDPSVDPGPDSNNDSPIDTPIVVIEDSALPGI
jgi:hypothetical protein